MNEKEILIELKKISQKFNDLIIDFDKLARLSKEEFKRSSFKGGPINEAANRALLILKFICKSSGIEVKVDETRKDASYSPVFKDYIDHAFPHSKNPPRVRLELETIRKIRNRCVHPDETDPHSEIHEELTQNKLESVRLSMEYIMTWFFKTYLKDKYSQFYTPVVFSENGPEPEYVKQNTQSEKLNDKKAEIVTEVQATEKKTAKRKVFFALGMILLMAIAFAAYINNPFKTTGADLENTDSTVDSSVLATTKPIVDLRLEAYKVLSAYYDKLTTEGEFFSSEYFGEETELKFLNDTGTVHGLSYEDILEKCKKSIESLNPSFRINIDNLEKGNEEGQWIYMDKLSSFSVIENNNSQKKVRIEFTLNNENKFIYFNETIEEGSLGGS